MRTFGDEFRRKKVAEFNKYKELKKIGYKVVYKEIFGDLTFNVMRWAKEYECCELPEVKVDNKFGMLIKNSIRAFKCECCGNTFRAYYPRKYCTTYCKKTSSTGHKKSSVCFDCVNYWGCREFGSSQIQDKMLEYEVKNDVVVVYKYKDFVEEMELNSKQIKIKKQAILNKNKVIFKRKEAI